MVENTEPSDGTACQSNSDCGEGYVCKNGRCVKAPDRGLIQLSRQLFPLH